MIVVSTLKFSSVTDILNTKVLLNEKNATILQCIRQRNYIIILKSKIIDSLLMTI